MSTGTAKRSLAQAHADAEALQALFPDSMYVEWAIAGSVRRRKPEVGDVEHVVMPVNIDRFWARVDSLLIDEGSMFQNPSAVFTKALYPSKHVEQGSTRWGEKYRGVMFRGFRHEIFLADSDNWAAILTIRTGPAEFSRRMVTQLQGHGYRQQDGYVIDAHSGQRVTCRTEEHFFAMCGESWTQPEVRR